MESIRLHSRFRRGITLMELLVVLAIIISITTVVLTSQSSFNKTLLLANAAYDIALTLRFTENLGIGTLASGGTTNAGRGAHFKKNTPGSFLTFADTLPTYSSASCTTNTPNCKSGDYIYGDSSVYGSGLADTLVQTYTLGNGMKISDFCARNAASGAWSCSLDNTLTSLNIVFARPNPDAFIRVNDNPCDPIDDTCVYTSACLEIKPLEEGVERRYVTIEPSGSITANASACPPQP